MTSQSILRVKRILRPYLKKLIQSKKFWNAYVALISESKKVFIFARSLSYLNRRFLTFSRVLANAHNVSYRGVICRKFPTDYVALQMLLWEVKPDLLIEIGTNHGGSALLFSDTLRAFKQNYKIHTIDIEDLVTSKEVLNDQNIVRFLGGFENYSVKSLDGFGKVMVIDDGSHLFEDVLGSMLKFSPFVSKDSYFVVEDGAVNYVGWGKQYRGGPLKAIDIFLSKNNDFEIDRSFENLYGERSSNNPNGYLRKIR